MNPTLRFRKARNSADELGQVFTPPAVASLLAEGVPTDRRLIVDIGAGAGSLAQAALKRCEDASAILIEKDPHYAKILEKKFGAVARVILEDALEPGLLESVLSQDAKPTILSNPPYGMLQLPKGHVHNPKEELPIILEGGGWARRDAAFLSRIWSASKKGASLGLIVTSAITSGRLYEPYRKKLVEELSSLTITELHPRTFSNTEVQAFLITGCRSVNRRRNIILRKADLQGQVIGEISITQAQAVQRLDYSYHSTVQELKYRPEQSIGTLSELGGSIARGSRSQNEFRNLGISAFHTTDFVTSPKLVTLRGAIDGFNSAHAGDILIPRVGSRCLLREAQVVQGSGLITDCIYRIRAPAASQRKIWQTLNSDFGREWRKLVAKGSCAKYITISTLSALPILA